MLNAAINLLIPLIRGAMKIAILLWPLWIVAIVRFFAGEVFQTYPWHIPAKTLSPIVLVTIAGFLLFLNINNPLSLGVSFVILFASGVLELLTEYQRLSPYSSIYSGTELLGYLDWYIVCASLIAILLPIIAMAKLAGHDVFFFTRKKLSISKNKNHGSANWFSISDAKAQFSVGELVIGEAYAHEPKVGVAGKASLLRMKPKGHLLTAAGTGAGKTSSIVVPNLLEWTNSLICIDPKSECEAITGRYRSDSLNQDIVILNPERSDSDGFNLLGLVDIRTDHCMLSVQAISSWMASGDDNSSNTSKFFEQAARNLIETVMIDVLFTPNLAADERTLLTVRKLIAGGDLIEYLQSIASSKDNYAFGIAKDKAGALLKAISNAEQTAAGIIGTADNMTQFLAAPSLAKLVCTQTFDPRTIRDKALSIYIQIPLKTLDSTPSVARLIVGSLANEVYEAKGKIKHPVLMMLDEMPRLGFMKELETIRDAARSYKLTMWVICQSLGQLEKIYGKAGLEAWMESCFVRNFFGVQDETQAERLSKLCGDTTIDSQTKNTGTSASHRMQQSSRSQGASYSHTGRRLITADEVMRMGLDDDDNPDEQLVFIRNRKPLRCGLPKYYRRLEYNELVDQNPFEN